MVFILDLSRKIPKTLLGIETLASARTLLVVICRKIPKTLLGIETLPTYHIRTGNKSRKIPKTLLGIETGAATASVPGTKPENT